MPILVTKCQFCQEINCKKNKVGQCFKSDLDFVNARKGREDSVKFGNSKLILSINLANHINRNELHIVAAKYINPYSLLVKL